MIVEHSIEALRVTVAFLLSLYIYSDGYDDTLENDWLSPAPDISDCRMP